VVYLLDHGAAIDETVSSTQKTALSAAATYREIDILRMLLSRGASLDHFDAFGFDAVTNSIISTIQTEVKVATIEILKVINEHGPPDTSIKGSRGHLRAAATFAGHREIDFLASLGYKVDDRNGGYGAIDYAALNGNSATYFALLAHGATTERAEHELLRFVDAEANPSARRLDDFQRRGMSDPIIKDLLNQRLDLMTSICMVGRVPRDIQDPAIPLQQAVAAYGPEIEAWFLGLLKECGLGTEQDRRRLQKLRLEGHDQHGTVIGEVQDDSNNDRSNEDVGEQGQSSAESDEDDAEEDERFWDAEEGE
jgi:hypothetical protein